LYQMQTSLSRSDEMLAFTTFTACEVRIPISN
jgi:hypothetical protein